MEKKAVQDGAKKRYEFLFEKLVFVRTTLWLKVFQNFQENKKNRVDYQYKMQKV